ncbi:glycosyltransferase [Thalassospira sp. MCCC 1A01428]|uniref:glycosyltransferase family 2 protein n=1 Tax=Thalassospira sp. MCCC 1A01428 TaxID=1470575 RepID=UPI00210FC6F6|nr:glycosyltransferase family 2 protein [Thalassospira sp. MCCC 1A01428]
MFWHFFLLELPRFVLAALTVSIVSVYQQVRSRGALPARPFLQPSVSVLLPGHNEAANLERSIMSMREQTCPPDQIVVVDDGSIDNTLTVARRLQKAGLVDVVRSAGVRGGKSSAANLGLTRCTGDLIIIADADTTYDCDAFERLIMPFSDPSVGAVAGNLGLRNPDHSLATIWQAIQYQISIGLGRQVSDMLGILFIVSGAFGAFRRKALVQCGGWSVGPGEDAELTNKIRRAGWKVRFARNSWGLTDAPETFSQLARQRLRWDRSLIRMRWRRFRVFMKPGDDAFHITNALGTIDILFFQAFLSFSFVIYLVWLVEVYGAFGWIIATVNLIAYSAFGVAGYALALLASPRKGMGRFWIYVFGYGLFNSVFLRAVRLYACFDELIFRHSFDDNYVPRRVRQAARRAGDDL